MSSLSPDQVWGAARSTPRVSPAVIAAKAGIHLLVALLLLFVMAGCEREERSFQSAPPGTFPPGIVRMSSNIPGPPIPVDSVLGPYGDNAYAVSQGQQLFNFYNCNGCHSNGGGGMGPPLMDDEWIYGSSPRNIFETIVQGRPNGMPSFGGRIPDQNVWELVAYVRSLSGLTPSGTRSARTDHMMSKPGSQSLMKAAKPKSSSLPPAAIQP
jgi:cytochrome c oxidase cbb3-type subunit 3